MRNTRRIASLVLLILLASLIQWPQATAITPQQQTIRITDTHDDLFITETGIGIDSQLCHITDPNMDIRSFLVFRELEINYWEPLHNATLRFRTTATLDFDADSSVTIYGMRYSDLQLEGWLNPGWILSVPLTSTYVNVNTSQFYGQTWHEVNVTTIVEELIRHPNWDGDGHAGTETGDAIGFIILGAEGYDTRWFIDYLYGTPSLATQLVIHWNHEPPPPVGAPDLAEYVQEYLNYTIWYVAFGPDYVFTNGSASPFNLMYSYVGDVGDPVLIDQSEYIATSLNQPRKLVQMDNGTLYYIYRKELAGNFQIYVQKSEDNGNTWTGETRISTTTDMEDYDQTDQGIAIDSNDYLHAVWQGRASGFTIEDQIWYAKYDGSWSVPIRISTHADTDEQQRNPAISVDSNNYLHVVWTGTGLLGLHSQIAYNKYTNVWSGPVRLSTGAGMVDHSHDYPAISVASNNYLYAVWTGTDDGGAEQIWSNNYTNSWQGTSKLSTYAGMNGQDQQFPCIASNNSNQIHVTWSGQATGFTSGTQIWYNNYNGSWVGPVRISTYTGMEGYGQSAPSVALDSDDHIHVMWSGKATGLSDENKIWYAKYIESWDLIASLQQIGKNSWGNIMWSRWPMAEYREEGQYFIADENDTIVQDDLDSLDDATDWIDIYDPDPEDPDPGGQWSEGPGGATGPLTRFRMRLYFLVVGMGCLFGPILFFASKRPSGYYILCGFIIMLMGIGLLMSIGQV